MSVLALIAASSLVAANWREQPVIAFDDYPQSALLREKSAASIVNVLVDPDGKVVDCSLVASSGDEQLASQVCSLLKFKRANAAIDSEGRYSYGFKREFIKLYLPGTYQGDEIEGMAPVPDVEFDVASLQGVDADAVEVEVLLAIDKSGKPGECDYRQDTPLAAYAKAACAQAKTMDFDRLSDSNGAPIDYVRSLTVRFKAVG